MQGIPKIIHYCWFGGNPLPEKYIQYINSWKKQCPEYEIREWNENNFDIACCDYIKEAYVAKKWAFVSDYARFKILYEYGGLYFDTDVELIKSIDDIISEGPFMGIEKIAPSHICDDEIGVAPGLGLGALPNMEIYKEIIDHYNQESFVNKDGTLNEYNVVQRTTDILHKHGFIKEDIKQKVKDINIYPSDFFCPMDCATGKITITENTVAIHYYACSWMSSKEQYKKKIQKFLGPFVTQKIIDIKRKIIKRYVRTK